MRVKIFLLSTLILNVVGQFDSDPRYGRFPTEYDDYFDQVPSPQGQENYNQENNNQQWQQQNNFSPTTQRSRQPGEISQAKCKEYSQLSFKKIEFISLSLGSKKQSISSQNCDRLMGLVVGGSNAKISEFPHQAAIGYPDFNGKIKFICGGSLISDRFVLTAAHCRKNPESNSSPTIVRLGDHNLNEREPELPEIDVPIESFISHEEYRRTTKENDIAVIKMKTAVTFSTSVRPACLQVTENLGNVRATATGWGRTRAGSDQADILQKVDLTVFTNKQCERFHDDIQTSQLCAGVLSGGRDTCEGDSGGPLQISDQCVFTIVGVTSYGLYICGSVNAPGVYTRVSSFIDWIERKVWY